MVTAPGARLRQLVAVLKLLRLARDEFLGTVDAAQLQDVTAYGGFRENRQIAAGRNRYRHLPDLDAHDLLASRLERKAFQRHEIRSRPFEMQDQLEILARAQRRFAENRADVQHAEAAYFEKVLEQRRAAAFECIGAYPVKLHHIVGDKPAAAPAYQLECQLALADAGVAGQQHSHTEHIQKDAV